MHRHSATGYFDLMRCRGLLLFTLLLSQNSLAAPEAQLWPVWDMQDDHSTIVVDHQLWQDFLDNNVQVDSQNINRVPYRTISQEDQRKLANYLKATTAIDPRSLNKSEQLAYWINLYNALTVQVVLDNPKKDTIIRMGKAFFSVGPWNDELTDIAGETLTLNDIEHRILRPIWQDHRIHFAVNCASYGCPNLSLQAYNKDNVEQQLAQAEKAYINHPRGLTVDSKGHLTASSIFTWYQKDFANNEAELLAYLASHHESKSTQIKNYRGKIKFDYDWDLNNQ